MAATPQNVLSQFGFNGGYVDVGWVMTGEPSASRRSRPGPRRLGETQWGRPQTFIRAVAAFNVSALPCNACPSLSESSGSSTWTTPSRPTTLGKESVTL